jgi:hypothetical protein
MDFQKKKLKVVAENDAPRVDIPTPVASKLNGVLALLREKVMREYGFSAEDYAGITITISNGKLTISNDVKK